MVTFNSVSFKDTPFEEWGILVLCMLQDAQGQTCVLLQGCELIQHTSMG